MRYGSIAQVKKMLRPEETARFGTDVDDRLTALQAAVSATLERELGRSFGVVAPAVDELHWGGRSSVLVLRRPYRDVSTVTVAVTVSGGTAAGGQTLDPSVYAWDPYDGERGWIYGLRRQDGLPWGATDGFGHPATPVLVTGYPAAGDDDAAVPAEITYAANYLILQLFKRENASAAGFIGPDGTVTPMADPYQEPQIVRILEQYRARRVHRAV